MKKYLKFLKKQKQTELELEDKKMPMTEVSKIHNSLKFTHPGQGNQVSAARTSEPLPSNAAVVYFEAYIKSLPSRYEVGVGVIQKDCALKRHPGQSNMSIGYLSSGDIRINSKKVKSLAVYKAKSTVGIGVIYSKNQVFFTLDGKLLQTLNFEYNPAAWPKFYPCISLRSEGDQIQLKFKNFQFNFEQLKNKIEKQCIQQVEKESIESLNIYTMVGDYLKFHGYNNTYNKLKNNHSFVQLSPFVQHPYFQSKIQIMDVQNGMREEENKNIGVTEDPQDELIMNRKCSTRQRIMSDYWGDILPNQQPRKKVYETERILLESRRKSSVISNVSNEQADYKTSKIVNENQENQNASQQIKGQKQKFLLETRIKVLKLIRQQKIEEAQQLLQQSLPQLFELLDYLKPYFYMHVYLRILKNEGANRAMIYMRNQAEKFKKFKEQLYPVYNKEENRLKFLSFTQMMGLISLKSNSNHDALTTAQFYAFSNYLNQLILKNMGLYPQSRLDTLVNHLKNINSKNQQYQINGFSFLCDI